MGGKDLTRFAKYCWSVLGINLLVILWGAYVRATGSGAGCGAHWPLCNGEVIPRAPQLETIVEFTHRLSSGVAFLAVVGLLVFAFRLFPASHPVRKGAVLAMFFMVLEALVGAGLVLFKWVADDQSVGRVISISLHLVITFLLLASLALTAWWASGGASVQLPLGSPMVWIIGVGFLGITLLGISGAITALGDTLFPAESLVEGIRQDFSETAHFLIRLRVWHPIIAIVVGLFVIFISILAGLEELDRRFRKFAWILGGLFILQLAAGLVNLLLLAPIAMQLVHLLLADLVWIAMVLFTAVTFRKRDKQRV
jgi:heme A synthase